MTSLVFARSATHEIRARRAPPHAATDEGRPACYASARDNAHAAAHGPLSRPTHEAISSILEGGGFSDVEVEEIELDFEYDSPEEFTRFIREIAPPVSNASR